jgi:hypothetical protein
MRESTASVPLQTACAFARVSAALDGLSSVVAGFALLAGARAFMFTALLGWREPVLGGAGLVLLAAVGWLRWRCGGAASDAPAVSDQAAAACEIRATANHHDMAVTAGHSAQRRADAHDLACYNRTSPRWHERGARPTNPDGEPSIGINRTRRQRAEESGPAAERRHPACSALDGPWRRTRHLRC